MCQISASAALYRTRLPAQALTEQLQVSVLAIAQEYLLACLVSALHACHVKCMRTQCLQPLFMR